MDDDLFDEDINKAIFESLKINEEEIRNPLISTSRSSISHSWFSNLISRGDSQSRKSVFTCHSCSLPITSTERVEVKGFTFHRDCFLCAGCHQKIEGNVNIHHGDNLPYHPNCYIELFSERCVVCSEKLIGKYLKHSYFTNEKYCLKHDLARDCYSCNRKERKPNSFVNLLDGRCLCDICSETLIVESDEAREIYSEILLFMENNLKMHISKELKDVPILAVDIFSLNENAVINKNNDIKISNSVRGLTISSTGEIKHFKKVLPFNLMKNISKLNLAETTFKIEKFRRVTAILVLYGLPRDLCASIIAHEAMHAWFKLNDSFPFDLDLKVEEGMCQYISKKYLDYLSDFGTNNSSQVELYQNYYRYRIENDPSEIYGEGYRMADKVIHHLGLDIVLEFISQNKCFPSI